LTREQKSINRHQLRLDAETIFRASVAAVEPETAVRTFFREVDSGWIRFTDGKVRLPQGRLIVIGAGKAAAPMAKALEGLFGARIDRGLVVTKDGHGLPLKHIDVLEASHPVPDSRGMQAAQRIIDLLADTTEKDLVITLLSGGGSALLAAPVPGISLADKIAVTDRLLACGADIGEINCVRKHLSAIKGGQLARAAAPAAMLTLVVSDVIGDPLDVIASGPTVPDPTSFSDAHQVLDKYHLLPGCPDTVRQFLNDGMAGMAPETPGEKDLPAGFETRIIAGNRIALKAAAQTACRLGYHCEIFNRYLSGEARVAAASLAKAAAQAVTRPTCLLAGGETTVTLRGDGQGGRNQEFALAAADAIEGAAHIVILAAGTDGTDGPTDAAGAIVDGGSLARGREAGLEAATCLRNNDSYTFHKASGDLLITGPTRTNVMDIYLALISPGDGTKGPGSKGRP